MANAEEMKLSLPVVIGAIVYAVSISAYIFGLRGDIERLEQRIGIMADKQEKIVNEVLNSKSKIGGLQRDMYFVLHGCCSDMIADSIKILNPKNQENQENQKDLKGIKK